MKKNKALDIFLLIMKILLPLFLLVPLIFFCRLLIDSRISDIAHLGEEGYFSGFGLSAFLQGIVMAIVNATVLALTWICLLISHRFRSSEKRENHLKYFKRMLAAPFANMALFVLAVIIIAGAG